MTQEISASPRVGQTRQGDAIALSRRIGDEPTLLHIDAADYEAQVAAKAAARTESAALSAQLAVGGVASEVAAAKVMITAGLSGFAPLTFRGYWDASTNSPDLLASNPMEGDLWVVSKAGTTEIGAQKDWHGGDAAWFHDGAWVYYARAGWAAVAQTIHAIEAINAGSVTIQEGGDLGALEITDAVGNVIALIRTDGTYASGLGGEARYSLSEQGVKAGAVQLLDDTPGLVISDSYGFVVARIGDDGSFTSAAGDQAAFSLHRDGVKAGAVQLLDKGDENGLTIMDGMGLVLCHLSGDGSFRSDFTPRPRFGLTDQGMNAGDIGLLSDTGATGLDITDGFGFAIARIGQDGSYRSSGAKDAPYALDALGIRAGAVAIEDSGAETGLVIIDRNGCVICHIGTDGSYKSGLSAQSRYVLAENAVRAGDLALLDDGRPEFFVIDKFGFLIMRADGQSKATPIAVETAARPSPGSRPPAATDDQTRGLARGALWCANGTLWRLLKADAGLAIWKRLLTPTAHAADLFARDLAAAYGTKRLVSTYEGPLLDIGIIRDGAVEIFTVGQMPDGALSPVDLARAASCTDAPLCVVRLYDQSGQGHHMVSAGYDPAARTMAADRCPHIGVRDHSGQALISWACEPNPIQAMRLPQALTLSGGNATAILAGAFSSTNAPPYSSYQALSLGSSDDDSFAMTFGTANESGRLTLTRGDPFSVIAATALTPSIDHGLIALRLQPGDVMQVDMMSPARFSGSVLMPGDFSSRVLSGGAIGATHRMAGHSCALQLSSLTLLKRAVTDAEMDRLLEAGLIIEGITPQLRDRLDCIGSSSTQGYNNKDGWCWPQMLAEYLASPVVLRNWAVPGAVSADTVAKTLANILADRHQVRKAYALTWIGANDIYKGIPLETIIQNNATIHKGLRDAGYQKIFILGQFNRDLTARIHAAVRAGVIDADGVIDPVSEGPMSDHGDRELYSDGAHPTEAGDRMMASFIAAQLNKHFQEN
ncbi:SGNH/GDSL hydrolase family protein [Asaia bogorensis]|uniref:SGNH/GDSL hydrolase family protein n=1 Tax=Asaia bogorensis TaxID=91915 RepID=UPI0028569C3B|nr:GDSL-type esterase/lipase family protein [Asaia bogorensis]MDR6182107.1 lysophospholipase L1-like esterase [Asaia bogorensis NBRC 16594]